MIYAQLMKDVLFLNTTITRSKMNKTDVDNHSAKMGFIQY